MIIFAAGLLLGGTVGFIMCAISVASRLVNQGGIENELCKEAEEKKEFGGKEDCPKGDKLHCISKETWQEHYDSQEA